MNVTVTRPDEITFDQVFALAQSLRPIDQARLVIRLAPKVESLLDPIEVGVATQPRNSLRGLLADLGPAPSAEEIDSVQREMWASFMEGVQ